MLLGVPCVLRCLSRHVRVCAGLQRLFLGLASGSVQELSLLPGPSAAGPGAAGAGRQSLSAQPAHVISSGPAGDSRPPGVRLVADKRVCRGGAVSGLACLPPCGRLLVLGSDGVVSLASYDSWVLSPLQGVRSATAMAVDGHSVLAALSAAPQLPGATATASSKGPAKPVRVAVAVKGLSTAAKLLVYGIPPSPGGGSGGGGGSRLGAGLLAAASAMGAGVGLMAGAGGGVPGSPSLLAQVRWMGHGAPHALA